MKTSKEDGTLTDLGTVPTQPLDVVTSDNTEDDVDVLIKKAMKNNKGELSEDSLGNGYRVDNAQDGTLYVESPAGNKYTIEGDNIVCTYNDIKSKRSVWSLDLFNAISYLVEANKEGK
jgi:hypothetical protein